MNIVRENTSELNAVLKVQLGKDDYEGRVNKILNDYRRKARFDGFRPGKVPLSMVSKLYRKPALVEEINKIINESLNEYIKKEELNILGDPMPMKEQKPIDWDRDVDFEFAFEIGLAPKLDFTIGKKDKFTSYEVLVDDEIIDTWVGNFAKRYGKYMDVSEVKADEMLKGDLAQIDDSNNLVEGGLTSNDITLYLEFAKDEIEKQAFMGAKAGDSVNFDIKKTFPNDIELANLLKIDKEKVAEAGSRYRFIVKSVSMFEKATVDQDLFDKLYGAEKVTSEIEFRNRIADDIKKQLKRESDYKLSMDARAHFLKKADMKLPSEFLKRWLTYVNEGKLSEEQVNEQYPSFEEAMKWQLIKSKIIKENNIEAKEDEIIEYAKAVSREQFANYGMYNVEDSYIQNYAIGMLKKEEEVRRLVERLMEDKVLENIRLQANVEEKNVSREEFEKILKAE